MGGLNNLNWIVFSKSFPDVLYFFLNTHLLTYALS